MPGPPIDVFVDESGNTGPDLANVGQPVYVLGGWLIKRPDLRAARLMVRRAAKSAGLKTELKSGAFLGKSQREQVAASLFLDFMKMGIGLPAFVLCEKRYCMAAKLVETFLDPDTNPSVEVESTGDALLRRRWAHEFYHLPLGVLAAAWNAVRKPDPVGIADAIDKLELALADSGLSERAVMVGGAKPAASEIARLEQQNEHGPRLHGTPTFSLITLATGLDALGSEVGARVRLVHDETATYERVLSAMWGTMESSNRVQIGLNNGNVLRLGFDAGRTLEFAQSKGEELIQAADLLVGTLRAHAIGTPKLTPELTDVVRKIWAMGVVDGNLAFIVGSDDFLSELTGRL